MATPVNLKIDHQDSSRTGLVSSFGGHQRSYGTVKEHIGPTYRTRHSSLLQHEVQEGDTFPGLALKYSVTVHQIQRLNNLWYNESIHSRTVLKIPTALSRSLQPSPVMAAKSVKNSKRYSSIEYLATDGIDTEESSEREKVRRKAIQRMSESDGTQHYGEKTIADIFNSADEQLMLSRQFAEKLAKRSAALKMSPDAYNRTPEVTESQPENDTSHTVDQWEGSSHPKQRKRRVERTPDRVSKNREELEEALFEL